MSGEREQRLNSVNSVLLWLDYLLCLSCPILYRAIVLLGGVLRGLARE